MTVINSAPINSEEVVVELMWSDIKNHLARGAPSHQCEGRSPAQVIQILRDRADNPNPNLPSTD